MSDTAKRTDLIQQEHTSLAPAEQVARLRLIRSQHVGPITFFQLLEKFGTAETALRAIPGMTRRGGGKKVHIYPIEHAEAEIEKVIKIGAHIVHWGTAAYPPLLAHIDDAPPILTVRGHLSFLRKRAVAIVGARNSSLNGQRFAQHTATAIGGAGFLVVSGMARGIDTSAHKGALKTGTIAILGGGVDIIYPRENEKIYSEIIERGAVCAEAPLGTRPQARHFPRRNRIISGMCRGIMVVEAGARSGSLITARMALEQGREVFAVPGPPQDPRVKGTNMLIRDGAMLTETADDVIQVLREQDIPALHDRPSTVFNTASPNKISEDALPEARTSLINKLDFGPTDIDDIVRETGQSAGAISVALLELELAGKVVRLPGNRISLVAD